MSGRHEDARSVIARTSLATTAEAAWTSGVAHEAGMVAETLGWLNCRPHGEQNIGFVNPQVTLDTLGKLRTRPENLTGFR